MVNVEKHITYWLTGAKEDWEVAKELVASGRYRHGLFFGHLGLEKLLKAHVCRYTTDVAPRLHNLVRLAELIELPLDQGQIDFLAEMNAFNLESRYPDAFSPPPTREEAEGYIQQSGEIFRWLTDRL